MRQLLFYMRDLLLKDTIPVWMSLLLMFAGAWATYWVAPKINAQFEIQTARREFLVKNLETFATDTKQLIDIIAKSLNENSNMAYEGLLAEANPNIAKLQFSATQLLYIVPERSSEIISFQTTLGELQNEMLAFKPGGETSPVLGLSKKLLSQSLFIYEQLLIKTGLGSRVSGSSEPIS